MSKKDEEGEEWKLPTLDETIAKMKKNSFQYATAGDVRRLINEIERLREIVTAMEGK